MSHINPAFTSDPPDKTQEETEVNNTAPAMPQKKPCFSMPIILFNLAILHIFYISYFVFSAGTVRTIEKRFDLSSTQTGLMNSFEDMIQVALCIFPSYLGLKMHKLRLLGLSMMVAAIGVLLTNIPYAVYGAKTLAPDEATTDSQVNSTLAEKMALGMCVPGEDYQDPSCRNEEERNSNEMAYTIFILTNILVGLGTAGTNALATSYIDENTPTDQAPVYLGIFQASKGISPVIGSLMAAAVLKLPENLSDSVVNNKSPSWIGAWWLGYTVIGVGLLITSFPLLFTPRHHPYYYDNKKKDSKTENNNIGLSEKQLTKREVLKRYLKRFFNDLRLLLTNGAFMAISTSILFFLYVIVGIFINLGRYMEIHFRLSSSFANVITAVSILTSAIGTLIGGLLMKKFKPSTPTAAKIFTITLAISSISTCIIMFVPCNPVNLAGERSTESLLVNVDLPCANNCTCSRKYYRPVCVDNNLNFLSACHAGCLDTGPNKTFTDCSCVAPDLKVTAGQCEGPCSYLYIYVVIMAVGSFISSLGKVPAIVVSLRVMDKNLKSLGLGIQSFMFNLFTFIPGPLIFGAFFDSSCMVWKSSCGNTGNCLLYDTDRFRLLMHGPTGGFTLIAAVFAFITYWLIRNDPNIDAEDRDTDKQNDETTREKNPKEGSNGTVARSTRL